jgi:hypothetical protein
MNSLKYSYPGIYRGVVADNADPQNLRRLKLHVPQIFQEEVTSWAWEVGGSSTSEEVPVVSQGVWVAFEGGDPSFPIWLGTFGTNKSDQDSIHIKPWDPNTDMSCIGQWVVLTTNEDGTVELDLTETVLNMSQELCTLQSSIGNYGSFYDTSTQSAAAINTAYVMKLNTTDLSNNVSVQSGSQITVTKAGKYNLQFSAQLHNNGGGGSGNNVFIWLRKNGVDVSDSATRVDVISNSPYVVAAWNFVVDLAAGGYVELVWSTTNTTINIPTISASGVVPRIPSLIVTMTQVA